MTSPTAQHEPAIQTPRLYLERMDTSIHLRDFHELWMNEEAVRWTGGRKIETLEEARVWMDSKMPNAINPDIDKFAIMLGGATNAEGRPKMIGMVGTNRWSKDTPGLETGYCLNIGYWGKGYATEAFAAFLEHYWTLSERKNVNLLVAKTAPLNIASQRVLQKCGARRGETLKDSSEPKVDQGTESDIWCWYFDRPGSVQEEVRG